MGQMNKNSYVILVALFFSSCATILNSPVQHVSIVTSKRIEVVSVDSSMNSFGGRNSFYLRRGKDPLRLNLLVDSVEQKFAVKAYSSFAYWINIYFNYGIGLFFDKDNPKRYTYPRRRYLRMKGDRVVADRFAPTLKGTKNWHIAVPHSNFFRVATPGGHKKSEGFLGIETGLDYVYKDNRFISVYGGAATDFIAPLPVPIEYFGEHESSSGIFVNARNNYRLGSFDLGYGISYSALFWRRKNPDDITFIPQAKTNSALGLSFTSSFRFGEYFHLGFLYQPYFVSIGNKTVMDYQHQISIELIWKNPF